MYTGEYLLQVKGQIIIAMEKSQIVDYEDEEGNPIYTTVTKEDAVEKVMELFDSVAYHFFMDNASGCAIEEMYGPVESERFHEYMAKMNGYLVKEYEHYTFENDEDIRDTFVVIDGGKKE